MSGGWKEVYQYAGSELECATEALSFYLCIVQGLLNKPVFPFDCKSYTW